MIPIGAAAWKKVRSVERSSQKNVFMYSDSAASAPTIRNTTSTPKNSQRNDAFFSAPRVSRHIRAMTRQTLPMAA